MSNYEDGRPSRGEAQYDADMSDAYAQNVADLLSRGYGNEEAVRALAEHYWDEPNVLATRIAKGTLGAELRRFGVVGGA